MNVNECNGKYISFDERGNVPFNQAKRKGPFPKNIVYHLPVTSQYWTCSPFSFRVILYLNWELIYNIYSSMRYFHAINPHLRIKFSFSFVIYMFT